MRLERNKEEKKYIYLLYIDPTVVILIILALTIILNRVIARQPVRNNLVGACLPVMELVGRNVLLIQISCRGGTENHGGAGEGVRDVDDNYCS